MENQYDVVIIGAGSAGLSAALYTARARLKTIVLEKIKVGGQITLTHEIANYPGAIIGAGDEPTGSELTKRMKEQVLKYGAEVAINKDVVALDLEKDIKEIECQDGTKYFGKTVIIATGAIPREIGCPGEVALKGKGVSYCATCDGPFFEELEVIVVGGGNAAVEEALFITNFASKVTIVQNLSELTADAIAIEQAKKNSKIDYIFDSIVEEISGDGMVEAITIKNTKTNELRTIEANEDDGTFGVFIFIGTIPQTKIFENQVSMNDWGYIITDENMATNIPGVFAAGDLRPKLLRQVITAAGDGATAAFAVQKYLEANHK